MSVIAITEEPLTREELIRQIPRVEKELFALKDGAELCKAGGV